MFNRIFIKHCLSLVTFFFSVALPTQLAAEQSPYTREISFEQLRAHAFANSPVVASLQADLAETLGQARENSLMQNPEFEAEVLFPKSYPDERGGSEYTISLSQPLRLSDFGDREALRDLSEKAATQKQKASLLEFSQTFFLQYVRLWASKERKKFISSMQEVAKEKKRLVQRARQKGVLGKSEVKLFQAAAARLKTVSLGLEADVAQAEAELSRLTAFDVRNVDLKRPKNLPLPSLEEAEKTSKQNPLGIASRLELLEQIAQKQGLLAKQDSIPGFTPKILYEHTDDQENFLGVGVSVELPFFNGNEDEIARSKTRERGLRLRRQYLQGDVFTSQLEGVRRRAVISTRQAESYEQNVLPLFREALSAAENQFNAGQGSVLQLWQAFKELDSANEELLELWVRTFEARSELVLLLGEEL